MDDMSDMILPEGFEMSAETGAGSSEGAATVVSESGNGPTAPEAGFTTG